MLKTFFIFISIFSLSFSKTYAPFHQRKFEYSVTDMCSYEDGDFQYVKPCPQNKVCNDIESYNHHLSVCQEYFSTIKTLGDSCQYDIECATNLQCSGTTNKICTIKSDNKAFKISEPLSSYEYYLCPDGKIPVFDISTATYLCNETPANNGNCLLYDESTLIATKWGPDFGKVCGESDVRDISNVYVTYSIKMNLIGEVAVGKVVSDELACESGFALYLYEGGVPEAISGKTPDLFLTCINLKAVEVNSNGECKNIIYSIGNTEYTINDYRNKFGTKNCRNIMTKLDLFRQYKEKRGTGCTKNKEYYDEPFTCGNDELRELWYFYHHPDEYLLYKNEQAIKEYLIQKRYPSFNAKYAEPQLEASGYLSIKFISLLILLLSL